VSDVTARWSDIGLAGGQPVRDLWQKLDLGEFRDSFTARIPRHGAMLLKVGRRRTWCARLRGLADELRDDLPPHPQHGPPWPGRRAPAALVPRLRFEGDPQRRNSRRALDSRERNRRLLLIEDEAR
jgi:hypothetical protein